jgi:hypothetical protein
MCCIGIFCQIEEEEMMLRAAITMQEASDVKKKLTGRELRNAAEKVPF